MATCSACGASNPDGFRFCGTCGAGLALTSERREARKTVTILFADVAGSTGLGERLDPEVVRRLMERYFEAVRPIVERHGGTVEKFIGDAVMAVFGIPTLHEDDALRAVRAAVEAREAVANLHSHIGAQGLDLEVRIGIETGEVVADDSGSRQSMVTGDAVNVAARLQTAAAPSEILIGEATHRLVRDSVGARAVRPLSLKGKRDPVAAFRLETVAPVTAMPLPRPETRMVGRAMELAELRQAFERVVRDGRCFLFTVIGAAGVGKSRLGREFIAQVGDRATVVRGRCLPYGEGITYWPIGEIVRQVAGIDPGDSRAQAFGKIVSILEGQPEGDVIAERVACAAGLSDGPATKEELSWGARRLLETLAVPRPLVVVVDDLQWAEPTLLDLVESIAASRESPILLLCPARPELLDMRPAWSGSAPGATTMVLEPLGATDAEALAEDLLDGPIEPGLRERIVETSEGNPLFVEELIGVLIDDERLLRDETGWRLLADPSALDIPRTIHALLAARLDRLPAEERATAERGSVIGRVFEQVAVAQISPESTREDVPEHLRSLVRRLLLGRFQQEGVYRFRHLLIRDAAYEALPIEERADLHEKFADWLERTSGDRVTEQQELLGYHLEQAHDYRIGLGLADEHTESLGRRAGGWLASAGELADDRRDARAAVALLTRAERLLPHDDPRYWPTFATLGAATVDTGSLQEGLAMLDRALPELLDGGNEVTAGWARLRRIAVLNELGRIRFRDLRAELLSIICSLPGSPEADRLRAESYLDLGGTYQNAALMQKAERAYRRALRYAARSGDETTRIDTVLGLVRVGVRTMMPVSEVMEMCRSVIASRGLTPAIRAHALQELALLTALGGQFNAARRLWDQGRQAFESVGFADYWRYLTLGSIEMMADDPAAAEQSFRFAYDAGERRGALNMQFLAARLSQALLAQGRIDEAERLVDEALTEEEGEGFTPTIAHGTKARILALQGRMEEALAVATENVADARTKGLGDLPMVYGGALEDLAFVQARAGRADEARASLEDALDRYERKGYVAGADRVGSTISSLPA